MIKIPIPDDYIEWAKKETDTFDDQKTYNKFQCDNNFIGILGERVLHEWLESLEVPHEWVELIKQQWNEPDFKIAGKTFDLKTTIDTKMWLQNPVHDYYIFSRVNDDMENLILVSYIKKEKLLRLIKKGELESNIREFSTDYQCEISHMKKIEKLFKELFKDKDIYTERVIARGINDDM